MALSALQAARKVCKISDWKVTNLQLQKILYLAHMIYMGRNKGERLVSDDFEAWAYGPVLPTLYHFAKMYGSSPIKELPIKLKEEDFQKEVKALKEACDSLLSASPRDLVAFTHRKGGAWDKSYKHHAKGILISDKDILAEYEGIKQ